MSVNQPSGFVKRQDAKADAFLGGKLSIEQSEKGFRAGLDSVLLGASVPMGCEKLLDLGAGAGVAALCALAHYPAMTGTLIEIDTDAVALAQNNIVRNRMEQRARILTVNATASGTERKALGLTTDFFDVVIANPPFFETGTRASHSGRAMARHADGDIAAWVRTAVSCSHAQGTVIFIHLAEALPQLLVAFAERLGAITVLPIAPRPGEPATRVLIRGKKGSKAPMRLLPPLVLHPEHGNGFSPSVDVILRGRATLDWH